MHYTALSAAPVKDLIHPPSKIELPDQYNLADHFIDSHLREGRGDQTAIVSGSRRLTYAEIAAQVTA